MNIRSFILALCLICNFSFSHAGNAYCLQSDVKSTRQAVNSEYHQHLESLYDVKFHLLNLDVERTSKYIIGSVSTVAKVLDVQYLDSFAFELHQNLILDSVKQYGQKLTVINNGSERIALLATPILLGDLMTVTIYYHGTPPTSTSSALGDGFSNDVSPSWGNRVTWSLSQPYSAYEWWPCKQALADKIDSSWFFITTDSTNKAGSNGVLTNVSHFGNKTRYEWKSRTPIDYYLISVAVAQYVEYNLYAHPAGFQDSILIQNYIYNNPQTLPAAKAELDKFPALVELFSRLFGLYPFANEKYGNCMAPVSGGMEHQTMTTVGFFDFEVDAHELAHQWFGDNVTCASWKDIFVNEGFASYSEYLADEFLKTSNVAASKMQTVHNNVMAQPDGAVWFTDTTDVGRIFDSRLTYDKGSAIIHSMRYVVNNDSLFFQALKNYQQQFKDGVGSALDFKQVLEVTTGIDFTQFYAQWFYGEGYPTFGVRWNQINDVLKLKVNQRTSAPITPLFITPVDYKIRRTSMPDTIVRLTINQNEQYYTLSLSGEVTGIFVDPNNWIMNKLDSVSKDSTLNEFAGTAELTKNVYAYPNPVKDLLRIECQESNVRVDVYSTDGRKVATQSLDNNKEINVSELSPATYFITVSKQGKLIGRTCFLKE